MKQVIFKRILHANDGSPSAFNALALALDIAVKDGSELHMFRWESCRSFLKSSAK